MDHSHSQVEREEREDVSLGRLQEHLAKTQEAEVPPKLSILYHTPSMSTYG